MNRLPVGPIAIFDVETTGLFPWRHDRIIEIGVVVLDPDGATRNEFCSLVNPGRDMGPSSVHGLTSVDVIGAPTFRDILGPLLDAVRGSVAIAGHNLRFDRGFLEAEFALAGVAFPPSPGICTMELGWGGNLGQCCRDYGVETGEAHEALSDARAAAALLVRLLGDQPRAAVDLGALGPIPWPRPDRPGLREPLSREEARRRQREAPGFLQRLLGRIPDQPTLPLLDGAALAYSGLLQRVLEDRYIDEREGAALMETALRWGLGTADVRHVHRGHMELLAAAALADGVVTVVERRDLEAVARLLGHVEPPLEEILGMVAERLLQPSNSPLEASAHSSAGALVGQRVCFTGELACRRGQQPISRESAEALAEAAGLVIADGVSKKLDLLVTADPLSQSGKAKKARQYGIRVMHEVVFWQAIGVEVD